MEEQIPDSGETPAPEAVVEPVPEVPADEVVVAPPEEPVEGALGGVVATAGGPLADATVWFGERKAVTDAKGRFLMEHLPPGPVTLRVIPPTPRFQDTPTPATVVRDKKTDVFLFLRESVGVLEGDVFDEEEKGIAGAQVYGYFRASGEVESVKADEKGHYRFEGISPGSHFIRASAPRFMTDGKSVEIVGGKSAACTFILKRGAIAIGGRVGDTSGSGIDAEIYLLKSGIVVTKLNTKLGDGSFSFHDLVPGVYELTIVAPGYAPTGWRGEIDSDKSLDFKLEKQVYQELRPYRMHGMPEIGSHGER